MSRILFSFSIQAGSFLFQCINIIELLWTFSHLANHALDYSGINQYLNKLILLYSDPSEFIIFDWVFTNCKSILWIFESANVKLKKHK